MSRATGTQDERDSPYREYILDVRIVAVDGEGDDGPRYRFEAPNHEGRVFENTDTAELYADVYFDVNGFEEAGTGDRGVPPVIIAAGRDTLAAYLLTLPGTDRHWAASFFGVEPSQVQRYADRVRHRAAEIREGALKRGVESTTRG